MRPDPLPFRSALMLTDSAPVMMRSAALPSFAEIDVTRHTGDRSPVSTATAAIDTGTIALVGGQIAVMLGATDPIAGGVVSTTAIDAVVDEPSRKRVASPANVAVTAFMPSGSVKVVAAIPVVSVIADADSPAAENVTV